MAQREGRPPKATLAGGLAELAADEYRKLLDIAAGARYPQRPALTYLAPLYTWLEMSRRRLTRLPLLVSLYRNYWRFRRARGRLPDAITGGEPFELAEALAVRFDAAAPGVETRRAVRFCASCRLCCCWSRSAACSRLTGSRPTRRNPPW